MVSLSSETEISIALLCQLTLHSSTNQELFKMHLHNQGSHLKIWTIFIMRRKPSHATTELTLFTVCKDEWNTKEDTGKSEKYIAHTGVCQKGTSRAEAMLNSEKIKPIALISPKLVIINILCIYGYNYYNL